jgi:hypothetical protein
MGLGRNPAVVADVIDGKAVLVDPAGSEIITLNALGTQVWDALDGTRDVDELCHSIGDRYPDVPAEQIDGDVRRFLGELTRLGLLSEPTPDRG